MEGKKKKNSAGMILSCTPSGRLRTLKSFTVLCLLGGSATYFISVGGLLKFKF